ncbi:MAG: CcdB family protein [Terricaulis sp.]|nr:CcdB family protein [Terricaulis sp.]
MNQFDVFENPEGARQANVPYVITIQSEHFINARTTVVVPLVRIAAPKMLEAVNPIFEVKGERLTLEPFQIAFIPVARLRKKVASLADERVAIVRAVDALMSGL